MKTWTGDAPEKCDLCKAKIDRYFVDGVVKGHGCWGILCTTCHSMHGAGLGTGRGQLYRLDAKTNTFIKIEG